MLNFIRKQSDTWMVKTILWMIVLAFVATIFYSWGAGGQFGGANKTVATVNGMEIKINEFDRAYGNIVNFYREQFRGQFSEEMAAKLKLKENALDALIQNRLVLLEAKKMNLMVSDQELAESIFKQPQFQKDDKFSNSLYQNYLRFSRINAKDFEENQRRNLLREKLEGIIKASTQISEREIQDAYKKENEKIKFEYIGFSKDYFKPAGRPSDKELQKYFDSHKSQFEVPEQIQVQYVKLTPKMVEDTIEIYEEDIKDYYDTNQGKYFIKKQYKASHILVKSDSTLPFGEDLSEEEKEKLLNEADEKAKIKAAEILKQIKEGADFGAMAKKHSADTASGNNGGSLGQFSKGLMIPEFEEALDKLKPGELGGPVKTMFGFHIIRLEEVKEEHLKPLPEVQEEIKKTLKEDKARKRIRRIAKKIRKAAGAGNDLTQAALEYKAETRTTEFITRNVHNVPEIGNIPEFFNTAFSLAGDQLSDPVNTPEASYLLKVIARKDPYIPQLNEVLSEVTQAVVEQKNISATESQFKALGDRLKSEKNLEKLAEDLKMSVEETPFINQSDSIPGIGNIQSIKDAVFALQPGETTTGTSRGVYYLIQMVEREAASLADPEKLKKIYTRLKNEKGRAIFQEWMNNVKQNADILIDQTLL
ncbi:MAG: SurA N-terminal domain-containing protein [Nitrospinota bacterium]|nr:SurA N-terminal domain-containing protein [Nitrospinota bacterium]